jgi:nucleoside 2-deoxyribosyltransferase
VIIYLAAPIDQVDESDSMVIDVRNELKAQLEGAGATVYDPYMPDVGSVIAGPPNVRERIRIKNIEALRTCDGVLAYLPDGVPSIGVPVEIERAIRWGKPLVAIGGAALMNTPTWERIRRIDLDVNNIHQAVAWLIHDIETKPTVTNVPTARAKALEGRAFSSREAFYRLVTEELKRAALKHPEGTINNTHIEWYSVWIEEMVEVVQAVNDHDVPKAIEELIQVGAMTQRFWQSLVEAVDAN